MDVWPYTEPLSGAWNRVQNGILSDYLRKWVFLGILIGIVAGVGAILFYVAIDGSTWLFLGQLAGYEPPVARGEGGEPMVTEIGRRWLIPVSVVIGGLISGFIVFTLAPEAEGHGTDAAIDAYHQKGGRIRSRIPFVKMVASAVTIGSGGSAGREGPTAQIAAGFGSWLGEVFHLTPADRRLAVAVGVGAGIGAIFKAPLGGALLSAEILYVRDFEAEALVPGFIASVIGYSIFGAWAGWEPVFGEGLGLRFDEPESLIWFLALGVACGVFGILYTRIFYGMRDLFHRVPVKPHFKPAIGGLVVGIMALFYPEILSMGYGWLQFALEGDTQSLALSTIIVLVFLKIVATGLTIGSGGSGGVFAPGLFIGGMVGAAMWGLLEGSVPAFPDSPAPFVIVGMMALFGGVAKAPIAVILMVAEMTNEFSMIIPAMLAVTVAYLITRDTRIYESQVETRSDSPAHRSEYIIPFIQTVSVADAMTTNVVSLSPGDSIDVAEERMKQLGLRGFPVVRNQKLLGIFTATDAFAAREAGVSTIGEAMSSTLLLAFPGDSLHVALRRMTEGGVSRLPVVGREDEGRLLGMISVRDVARSLDSQIASWSVEPAAEVTSNGHFDPFSSLPVSEAMSRDFDTFRTTTTGAEVLDRLVATGAHSALVVNDGGYLAGLVTLGDLRDMRERELRLPLSESVTPQEMIVARPAQSVADALAQPRAENVRQLPVVQGNGSQMTPIGLLRRVDVVSAYLRARDRHASISRRLLSSSNGNGHGDANGDELTTISISVRADGEMAGHTLSELALPHDAIVTSILRSGRPLIPRGRIRLEVGDIVQVTSRVSARDEVLSRLS